MSLAFLYWFGWLCLVLFSGWGWRGTPPERYAPVFGGGFLLWGLLFLIGLKVFGFPIHG